MGTAGLNVRRLAGMLARKKIDCIIIDGDAAHDHCVLRLTSGRRPAKIVFIEYENQGVEPRLAGLLVQENDSALEPNAYPLNWEKTLQLQGAREDDPAKIAQWAAQEF